MEYYKTLEGLTGEAFRIQLQNIITTFEKSTNPNYTTTYNSANDNLQDADEDLTNPNNIILIYNGASIKALGTVLALGIKNMFGLNHY